MKNGEIFFLGTASGLPTKKRFSQTIILKTAEELHLIDPGDGASSLLMKTGLCHKDIRSIIVSHMHVDHHIGLIQILKTCMHKKKQTNLKIFMPNEGVQAIKNFLDSCYLSLDYLGYPVKIDGINSVQEYLISNRNKVKFKAYLNEHLKVFKDKPEMSNNNISKKYESYSFVFKINNIDLIYSGNLKKELKEISFILKEGSILITELAHLKPKELIDIIKNNNLKKTYITHFNSGININKLQTQIENAGLKDHIRLTYDGYSFII